MYCNLIMTCSLLANIFGLDMKCGKSFFSICLLKMYITVYVLHTLTKCEHEPVPQTKICMRKEMQQK